MSYKPTVWRDGDLVTASKLNKMEQGVAGAGNILIVHEGINGLDKTYAEIRDALANGTFVILLTVSTQPFENVSMDFIITAYFEGVISDKYVVITTNGIYYKTSDENGYPAVELA